MPEQEPDPHEFPRLLDSEVPGFASNHPPEKLGKRQPVELTEEEEAFLTSITTSGQYSLAKVAAKYAGTTKVCNEENGQDSQIPNLAPRPAPEGNSNAAGLHRL